MSATNNQMTDVMVVGAGIVGICCALSVAESGKSVRLIDRDEPGQGASFGNAGIISPWSIVPQSVPGLWRKIPSMIMHSGGPLSVQPSHLPRLIPWGIRFLQYGTEPKVESTSDAMEFLNHSNVELYRQHLSGTGHENLIRDSWYVHAFRDSKKASLNDLGYEIRRNKGAEIELVGSDELRKLEPAISKKFEAAILIKGQARATSPGKIGEALAQKAAELGVIFSRAKVKSLEQTNSETWRADADNESFFSSQLVVAAGAWSAKLLRRFGLKLPLQSERGYHVQFPEAGMMLNNSVMDVEEMVVASSMEDGLRLAGTAEFAGLDSPPNEKRIKELLKVAANMLPDLNPVGMQPWMGIRPSFPDSLPMLGEFPGHRGLFAAFGHSHYGLMMAPKTGHIIADLISRKSPNIDLTPYATDRFT